MTALAPAGLGDTASVAAAVVGAAGSAGGVTFSQPRAAAVTLVTFAVLAVLAAGLGALLYRWYFGSAVPEGVAVLFGVAIVALYLNTTSLGSLASAENPELLTVAGVVFNVVALALAALVSPLGRYAGDRLATDVFALRGIREIEGEVNRLVRTGGRATAVTLPAAADIDDMDTYEPVPSEKKAEMAGKTLLFPRRLSVEELRSQLVERVKEEHAVGHVDVDLGADGSVEYFAVGSRATGLGPTLAPGRVAVALSSDPPNNATAGDMVQVWRAGDEPERVATGELRGVAGDVATVAVDESDAEAISVDGGYRLVILPAEPQADREFASLLRNADETMATVTVAPGSDLVGTAVGDVPTVVAAVRPAEGSVQAIPRRAYAFAAGDTAFLVARPDAIRRVEAAAAAPAGETPPAADDPESDSLDDSESDSLDGTQRS